MMQLVKGPKKERGLIKSPLCRDTRQISGPKHEWAIGFSSIEVETLQIGDANTQSNS
jgi:hypothetical protein